MKLALGTVQFGLAYGIANVQGRTPPDEAARILARAGEAGVDTLDTAAAYGESERVLGDIGVAGWRVVSKIPPVPADATDGRAWVRQHVSRSLAALRTDRLDGLLLHHAADLFKPQGPGLLAGLLEARAEGQAARIGYSIYSPQALPDLLERLVPDLVQAPMNVFDQRLVRGGWLTRLRDAGAQVHVRSVFLQGLLLMAPEKRPAPFQHWHALWRQWDGLAVGHEGGALSRCLGFIKAQQGISRIIVGVESRRHLDQLLDAWKDAPCFDAAGLSCDDPMLLEPSNWKSP